MTSNKRLGNKKEEYVARVLFDNGYWVHLFQQNKRGQPFDLVAIKNNIALMGDVKSCYENRFDFTRIEPNQYTSMELALSCGNTNVGFFLVNYLGDIYFISFHHIKELVLKKKEKSINLQNLEKLV